MGAHMDQLATIWAGLPDWVLEAMSRARALPYPSLHVLALVVIVAVLSRSLVAMALTAMLVSIAALALLAHPGDQQSWTVFWTACAASLLATGVAFHRHRLSRRVSLLREKVTELSNELADLRPKYQRELLWRNASEPTTVERGEKAPLVQMPLERSLA
jgi:hypothetical protein